MQNTYPILFKKAAVLGMLFQMIPKTNSKRQKDRKTPPASIVNIVESFFIAFVYIHQPVNESAQLQLEKTYLQDTRVLVPCVVFTGNRKPVENTLEESYLSQLLSVRGVFGCCKLAPPHASTGQDGHRTQ